MFVSLQRPVEEKTEPAPPPVSPFRSFMAGGFECACQKRADGVRLDLLSQTGHAPWARNDYAGLAALGIRVVRDGVRWHLVEKAAGVYDWSSVAHMAETAAEIGVQVIWDLCHYGWPDHVDVWSPSFREQFADFAANFAQMLRRETGASGAYCAINEISFLAWAGGETGRMNPFAVERGPELKRALAGAAIAATRAVRSIDPAALFISAEPLIHVAPAGDPAADAYRLAQYEAIDMILGRREPELGGGPGLIDVIGVNYYPDNQWYIGGATIPMGHHAYRPLADLLREVHERYGKPIFVSETGAEGRARSHWLHHVVEEVALALREGTPVSGICLYPIVDYPGWENGRLCEVGLFGPADDRGQRPVYEPFLAEIRRAQSMFDVASSEPMAL